MDVKFPIIYFFSSNFIFPPFNIKPNVERIPALRDLDVNVDIGAFK